MMPDIVDIKRLCTSGQWKAYVEDGKIFLNDTVAGETVCIGAAPDTADNERKLLALKFAYQIVTEDRNREKYCLTMLRSPKVGLIEFGQMLDLLNDIAKDLKHGGVAK